MIGAAQALMQLESLVAAARAQGASDLHLEPGLPPALRIRGSLKTAGEPVPAKTLLEMAREILGAEQWARFVERRSFDLSRTIQGVRCYIRNGDFFKIIQLLETGAEQGMWTWQRYQNWLEKKKDWHIPDAGEQADSEPTEAAAGPVVLPPVVTSAKPAPAEKDLPAQRAVPTTKPGHPIEIEPVEGGLSELIKRLEGQ